MERFNFKRLIVWQKAMDYTDKCLSITENIKGHYRLVEQLEACSASIPQNIAEGKGRNSNKAFVQFLNLLQRFFILNLITLLNIYQRRAHHFR